MSQRIARNVLYSGCCGARIVFVRVKASPCNLFVVSVYVPHSGRQAPSASDTLAELEALLSKVHQHDCVVLLGDFNAKLARHTDKMTGRWCIHRRANPAGDRLLGLMDRLQLCAVSTLHQPRRGSTNATYLSKDPRYGPSQIDYVMVSCRWATSAHKCCVKWGVSCQRWGRRYDHGLVSCVWVCRAFSQRKRDKQIDYAPLMAKDGGKLREHFDACVKQHLTATHCDTAVASASLERLTKCVTMAAQETLGVKKHQTLRKRCVSDRTRQLYEQRRRDFAKLNEDERRVAKRAISTSCREDHREHVNEILNDMDTAERCGNSREVSRLTRLLSGKRHTRSINPSKDLNGDLLVTQDQLLDEWAKFLGAKFASPDADKNRSLECLTAEDDELGDEELHKCLEALRFGKAPGCDNVPVEAYCGSVEATKELFRICRLMWYTELIPPELVRGMFVMLHKKGSRDDYRNYRAICLLCHSYKLMSAIVARRLMTTLEGHLPDTQAGFRPARGCRDNVCALKWFIEMILREGRQAAITFIDYSAAFDTESQMFLDEALAEAGVGAKVRRIVQAIFAAATGVVRLRHPDGTMTLSEPFDIARGVLQGDIFSPVAFIAGLDRIFRMHDLQNPGVAVGVGESTTIMSKFEYADDAALVDADAATATARVTALAAGSLADAAMVISQAKSKVMHIHRKTHVSSTTEAEVEALKLAHKCDACSRTFPTQRGMKIHAARWCDGGVTQRSRRGSLADRAVQTAKRRAAEALLSQVYVGNTPLENVYSFEYLGARMQCDGTDDADVRYRMAIAQTTFGSLSSIWTDHRLSRALKLRTYQLAVCSTLTHASEAWTLTEPVMRSVNGFNSRCLHIITGQDYRVTATAPEYDLLLAIRQRRLRYLGHILRMPESRVVRRALVALAKGGSVYPKGSLFMDCQTMKFHQLVALAQRRGAWNALATQLR